MGTLDRLTRKKHDIFFSKANAMRHYDSLRPERLLKEKGDITSTTDMFDLSVFSNDNQKVMPNPQNLKLLKQVYEEVPVVSTSVNNTANFAVQSGFGLEGTEKDKKTIESWIDENNFNIKMNSILKQMQVFGNCFIEVADVKFLPVHQMRVVVSTASKTNGQLVGYKQIMGFNDDITFKPEEIVHFKWNVLDNPFYGTSEITAVLGTLTRLLNYQADIGEVLHRYGNPLLHWKVGTTESPATQSQLSTFIDILNNREAGEDLTTSAAVEGTVVAADLKMIQPDGLLEHMENQLIAGLGVPEIFIRGGKTANRATALVEMQAFDRRVKAIRNAMSAIIEDDLFSTITPGKVMISWNELSIQDEETKSETFKNLTDAGMPIDIALKMVGWSNWVDDFEKSIKTNGDTNKKDLDVNINDETPEEKSNRIVSPKQRNLRDKGSTNSRSQKNRDN